MTTDVRVGPRDWASAGHDWPAPVRPQIPVILSVADHSHPTPVALQSLCGNMHAGMIVPPSTDRCLENIAPVSSGPKGLLYRSSRPVSERG